MQFQSMSSSESEYTKIKGADRNVPFAEHISQVILNSSHLASMTGNIDAFFPVLTIASCC